jgi:hypothetical protein
VKLHCPFKKTLLSKEFACQCSSITHLPTGCNIVCENDKACDDCNVLMTHLINAARFTLQFQPDTDSLTHGKLLKIQHGGLKGLEKLLQHHGERATTQNISILVSSVEHYWKGFENIPYEKILKEISSHRNRQRRSR